MIFLSDPISKQRLDPVAWVRRVNDRWIVHGGLKQAASAYLDHLARVDGDRLVRSCRHAHWLLHSRASNDDPKPWFYGGLFSLATDEEARRFLADHPYTASVIPASSEASEVLKESGTVGDGTLEKIQRMRQVIVRLAKSET